MIRCIPHFRGFAQGVNCRGPCPHWPRGLKDRPHKDVPLARGPEGGFGSNGVWLAPSASGVELAIVG